MPGFLSAEFGGCAGPAVSAAPQVSLGNMIMGRSTKVAVDATQKPTAANVTQVKQGAAGKCTEVKEMRANFIACIKQAQREILAACKAAQVDVGKTFANTTGPNSVAEIGLSAAGEACGMGSAATFMDALEVSDTILADRAQTPEGAMEAIKTALLSACHNSPDNIGAITDVNLTPDMDPLSCDWKAILTCYPDAIEMIMSFDENCYNPEIWSEMLALDNACAALEEQMAACTAVEDNMPSASLVTAFTLPADCASMMHMAAAPGVEIPANMAGLFMKPEEAEAATSCVAAANLTQPPPQFLARMSGVAT